MVSHLSAEIQGLTDGRAPWRSGLAAADGDLDRTGHRDGLAAGADKGQVSRSEGETNLAGLTGFQEYSLEAFEGADRGDKSSFIGDVELGDLATVARAGIAHNGAHLQAPVG